MDNHKFTDEEISRATHDITMRIVQSEIYTHEERHQKPAKDYIKRFNEIKHIFDEYNKNSSS